MVDGPQRLRAVGFMAAHFIKCNWRCIVKNPAGRICYQPSNRTILAIGSPYRVSGGDSGNLRFAVLALLFVWAFAAVGEEIAYRGYLLIRSADIGRQTAAAYWVGMIVVSILFGYGHFY